MIIYYRTKPFPRCKYCRQRMEYWIPGLADEEHSHTECAGKAAANELLDKFHREIRTT